MASLMKSLKSLMKTSKSEGNAKAKPQLATSNQNASFDNDFNDAYSDVSYDRDYQMPGAPRKLFTSDENTKDRLVGVVVTIFEGSSYDEMFRTVKPTTVSGERISTYSLACCDIGKLHDYLYAPMPVPEDWSGLMEDLRQVEADSVVFNWECCSACGDQCFPCQGQDSSRGMQRSMRCCIQNMSRSASTTMRFMNLALSRGHTVMCSDFSLKSLLFEWSEEHLGPNPFVKVGCCDGQFKLEFVPSSLQADDVPQQLQVVGDLCTETGQAVVEAMSDTIVYTVNPNRRKTDAYDLKVLTVVSEISSGEPSQLSDNMKCSIGRGGSDDEKKGAAGHVVLTYKSGGQLVTSMGHWIELTRINTSLDAVLRTAARNFGDEEVADFRREYAMQRSDSERYDCVQRRSKSLVSKSMPSQMKLRTKF